MDILRTLYFGLDALFATTVGLALFFFPHTIGDYIFVSLILGIHLIFKFRSVKLMVFTGTYFAASVGRF
jgi:hypothetical protein